MKAKKNIPPHSPIGKWKVFMRSLSDNPEVAADKYLHFHEALTQFFIHQGSSEPIEMADEAMELVAALVASRKISISPKAFSEAARYVWNRHGGRARSLKQSRESISAAGPRPLVVRVNPGRQREMNGHGFLKLSKG